MKLFIILHVIFISLVFKLTKSYSVPPKHSNEKQSTETDIRNERSKPKIDEEFLRQVLEERSAGAGI